MHSYSGLDVREVAHDYATSVSDYITSDLKLLNSYDTWHGEFTWCIHVHCIWCL